MIMPRRSLYPGYDISRFNCISHVIFRKFLKIGIGFSFCGIVLKGRWKEVRESRDENSERCRDDIPQQITFARQ